LNEENKARSLEEQFNAIATGEEARQLILQYADRVIGGEEIKSAMILDTKAKFLQSLTKAYEQIDIESRVIFHLEKDQRELINRMNEVYSSNSKDGKLVDMLIKESNDLQKYLVVHNDQLEKLRHQMKEANIVLVGVKKALEILSVINSIKSTNVSVKEVLENIYEEEQKIEAEQRKIQSLKSGEKKEKVEQILKSFRENEGIGQLTQEAKSETKEDNKKGTDEYILSLEEFRAKTVVSQKGWSWFQKKDRSELAKIDLALNEFKIYGDFKLDQLEKTVDDYLKKPKNKQLAKQVRKLRLKQTMQKRRARIKKRKEENKAKMTVKIGDSPESK
ncbi:MAG: hypothetical protein AB8B69_16395, partial [Chitinophagales bacterium]